MFDQSPNEVLAFSSRSDSLSMTAVSTPKTSVSSSPTDTDDKLHDLSQYIALGCLHLDGFSRTRYEQSSGADWHELMHSDLPDEIKLIIGNQATVLLNARWIRLFLRQIKSIDGNSRGLARIYLLPEDWARRSVDRKNKKLKSTLRQLFEQVDISPEVWAGDLSDAPIRPFDQWATAANSSLYYLFNKLPSPAPCPEKIKSRYTRKAVQELLESSAPSKWDEWGEQPLEGLKTKLYPYQARSASLMIQREAAPELKLDPSLEVRQAPDGEMFFYGARDGSFLQEPRFYETNRGGILAETMGLGKTIICLAVILATKGNYPLIPVAYQPHPTIRNRVGRLSDMAASVIGRRSIPGKSILEQYEKHRGDDLSIVKDILAQNLAFYEIPAELPRLNRTTKLPPSRQLVPCSGTIIVVPRNLLHQWQSEIRKHTIKGSLRILVVDTAIKRGSKAKSTPKKEDYMDFRTDLPSPTELMQYDVVLFTRNRFEQEIQDGLDCNGRRAAAGVTRVCNCPYIGATRIPDCNCLNSSAVYESPLMKLHWLRILIDEGHNFSSSVSNAVLVARQIQAERRWVVSGTPAKNLVGVEIDVSTLDVEETDPAPLRELTIEQRKSFRSDDENIKAAKALGILASNFLMMRPWCNSASDQGLNWDEHIYRHEDQYRKTYSGFSSCFERTLKSLVVKTRPEDVEKDIVLPPMKHRVVFLKPCWFDKMTANLFIQVLRANAVTSERSDVDYLFHKNSVKARHSLIRNLRQSNFTWTGFSLADLASSLQASSEYLSKEDKNCSLEDANSLLESSQIISRLLTSKAWIALSKSHEVGMAVVEWPRESEESFALTYPEKPTMVGMTHLLEGQFHVDSHILTEDPSKGLEAIGRAAKARFIALAEAEFRSKEMNERVASDSPSKNVSVPTCCVESQQPPTSRRASVIAGIMSPLKSGKTEPTDVVRESKASASPVRPRKRKLTVAEEMADLPTKSALRKTCVIGTTSAKLTYLLDKVMQHQATEKIIIFYDGDNAAFYIAQALEMLYINHRIYARTLENTKRSEYVALFNEDPDVRVLLIDVACGALGLNLNAASVVLIVNPINRPGLEAQAIKRAHRIGQTKEVLVETLVLENTIEHAIFNRAKNMSRAQHLEARELEDDAGIVEIIQNARILPVQPEEEQGMGKFAMLNTAQQVFGRPDRCKYHRYGFGEMKSERPHKRPNVSRSLEVSDGCDASVENTQGQEDLSLKVSVSKVLLSDGVKMASHGSRMENGGSRFAVSSIFGN